jgi:hypothetical protein
MARACYGYLRREPATENLKFVTASLHVDREIPVR